MSSDLSAALLYDAAGNQLERQTLQHHNKVGIATDYQAALRCRIQ